MNVHNPFRDEQVGVAPHNIEAEQALLGAMLVHNDAYGRVADFLLPEHFFDPVHARIYEAMASVIGAGKLASPITLRSYFEREAPITDGLTVPQYLGRLAANAATVIGARDYAGAVRDLFLRRQLAIVGEEITQAANSAAVDMPPAEILTQAEARLYEIAPKAANERPATSFAAAADEAIARMNEAYQRGDGLAGCPPDCRISTPSSAACGPATS